MKSAQSPYSYWIAFPFLAVFVTATCLGLSGIVAMAQDNDEKLFLNLDPANFDNSANIDNEWMPFKPGTRFVYTGTTVEDGETIPHRVVINITDLTKVIGGVRSVVTWDLDYSDDELVEAEIAFFAQDKEGNVWRMGEYPEEYEEGKLVAAHAWIHGIEDAKAGISMKAEPALGTPSYSQGWGPAVGFTDRGTVHQVGQKTTVPFGSYEDVLVIKESTQDEPDAFQLKYFARGVGNVSVGWMGEKEKSQELLELVKVEQLDSKGLAEVREGALKLEKSAFDNSKNVYAQTPAMTNASGVALKADKPAAASESTAKVAAKSAMITEEQAVSIAQKAVPGDVTGVAIEKKLGADRYVVEVLAKEDGAETDVVIDMETGKVLTTEK